MDIKAIGTLRFQTVDFGYFAFCAGGPATCCFLWFRRRFQRLRSARLMYPFLFRPDGLLLQLCLMLTALDCMQSSLRVPLRIGLVVLVLVFCGSSLGPSPLTTSFGYLP